MAVWNLLCLNTVSGTKKPLRYFQREEKKVMQSEGTLGGAAREVVMAGQVFDTDRGRRRGRRAGLGPPWHGHRSWHP